MKVKLNAIVGHPFEGQLRAKIQQFTQGSHCKETMPLKDRIEVKLNSTVGHSIEGQLRAKIQSFTQTESNGREPCEPLLTI